MAVKHRTVKLIYVDDDLTVRQFYIGYGRDVLDEIRIYIKDNTVYEVRIGGVINPNALSKLLSAWPKKNVITFLWAWMAYEYCLRTGN